MIMHFDGLTHWLVQKIHIEVELGENDKQAPTSILKHILENIK